MKTVKYSVNMYLSYFAVDTNYAIARFYVGLLRIRNCHHWSQSCAHGSYAIFSTP